MEAAALLRPASALTRGSVVPIAHARSRLATALPLALAAPTVAPVTAAAEDASAPAAHVGIRQYLKAELLSIETRGSVFSGEQASKAWISLPDIGVGCIIVTPSFYTKCLLDSDMSAACFLRA